jgi:hypothetical protein
VFEESYLFTVKDFYYDVLTNIYGTFPVAGTGNAYTKPHQTTLMTYDILVYIVTTVRPILCVLRNVG